MTFPSVDFIHGWKVWIKITDDAHGHSLYQKTCGINDKLDAVRSINIILSYGSIAVYTFWNKLYRKVVAITAKIFAV